MAEKRDSGGMREGQKPTDYRLDDPELIDRELMRVERDLQLLLGVLQSRKTKTLGRNYERRVNGTVQVASETIKRNFPGESAALAALQSLRFCRADNRLDSITSQLESAINHFAELRIYFGRRRVQDLQRAIQQLEFRLDTGASSVSSNQSNRLQVAPDAVSRPDTVFVIMPFAEPFTDVWSGGIERAAKEEGFNAIRVDMIDRSSDINDDIIEAINNCKLAIVDVTGNNPNVMFELGYAVAKEKPQIIISQSAEFLPFDIRNLRTLVYQNSWAGIEELSKRLVQFIRHFKSESRQGHRRRVAPARARPRRVAVPSDETPRM